MNRETYRAAWSWRMLGVAVLVFSAACQGRNAASSAGHKPRPTPAPTFAGTVDAASRADLLAYARGLGYDFTAPAPDSQYLLVSAVAPKPGAPPFDVGPWAVIAPESGAAVVSINGAQDGRVVAKLRLDGFHRDLKLAADTYYVWVDKAGGAWRSVLIPTGAASQLDTIPMVRVAYTDSLWRAIARLTPPLLHGVPAPGRGAPAKKGRDGLCVPCDNAFCCSAGGW